MKKVTRISSFVVLSIGLVLMAAPAVHAFCPSSQPIIGQPAGTQIDLGAAAADATPFDGVSVIQAAYWRFSGGQAAAFQGNPAPAAGADNGIWGNDGSNGGPWFADFGSNGSYFTVGLTDHDSVANDGCINGSNDAGADADDDVLLGACGPDGKFFVVAATNTDGSVFDFGAGPYTAINTPTINITGSTKVGTGVQITFNTPALGAFAPGYFDNGAGVPAASVFTGVRVYRAVVARNAGAPSNRLTSNVEWTLVGQFPLGANGQQTLVECGAADSDTYLGVDPLFDGGTPFDAGCVTSLTRTVQCGPTIAVPGDEPKPTIIRKPRGR